jgi:predicted O-linked N-acetylglucosamine transferase (SPINDLY family)
MADFIRPRFARMLSYIGRHKTPSSAARLAASHGRDSAQFDQAYALHLQGQLNAAETAYQALLQRHPNDFDLLHLLGMIQGQRGNFTEAAALVKQALAIDPGSMAALSTFGNCLRGLHRHSEALACYDKALAVQPDNADALCNRGATLRDLGRLAEALDSYDRALDVDLDCSTAHFNRGIVLAELKRYAEACDSYDRALTLDPQNREALNNRGMALRSIRRHPEALASFEQVLALCPDDPIALCNCGTALHDLERYADAVVSYSQALAICPKYAEALINRGATLRQLHRHVEALDSIESAIRLDPDSAVAHFYRGVVLGDLNRFEEALTCYGETLRLQPYNVEAHNNRGTMLRALRRHDDALRSYDLARAVRPDHPSLLFNRGNLLLDLKRMEEAVEDFARLVLVEPDYKFAQSYLLHAKMSCCDWRDLYAIRAEISARTQQGKRSAHPFNVLGVFSSAAELRRCAEIYASQQGPRTSSLAPVSRASRTGDRICIGYVAGEFRHQATSILMTELFERHDTGRFKLIAFDNGWDDGSAIRKRQEKVFAHMVDISRLGDWQAATVIRDFQVDILVDLNGYFGHGRTGVFSHRPAPIQVNWLGFPGTLGADYMDYIVADPRIIPKEHEVYYSEKVVRLPDTYQVNDSKREISPHTPTRAESRLPARGFVFCSFNNNFKITPEVFDVWMRLLGKVQDSVLWLLEDNAAASRNLRSEAAARGIAPERLIFAPRMSLPDHLARHRLADLFLDTVPCNAHTTASDALWAGLPLVSCMGKTFAGRVAGSLLHAIGLPELITENLAEYEALALKLATTPAFLADLRSRLARNRHTHPLFDIDRFRRHLESAYTTMYQRWSRGEAPASILVSTHG